MPGLAHHWRRGTAVPAAFAIAAVYLVFVQLSLTPGLNLWADVVTGLSSASLFCGLLAAGLSAFEGGRWTAANRARLIASARSPLADRLVHFIEVASPLLGGYLLALATRTIIAAVTGTYGSPSAWWLIALGSALVASAGFGYAVGAALASRLNNRWFVAPAVAVVFLAGYIGLAAADLPNGVTRLYPVIIELDSVFSRYVTSTMAGQCVLFCSATALLVTACGSIERIRRPSSVLVGAMLIGGALVITAVGGATAIIASNGQLTSGYNPRDFTCETRGSLTACLNRGYAVALDAVTHRFTEMNSRAAGTPLVAHRLEQNVEGVGDVVSRGARSVYVEKFGSQRDIAFAAGRYVEKYGGFARCGTNESLLQAQADEAAYSELYVDSWLSGDSSSLPFGTAPGESHLKSLRALSLPQANAWFRAHYARFEACELTFADLP